MNVRTHLRAHTSILKRVLVHAGGFNLGLVRSRQLILRTVPPAPLPLVLRPPTLADVSPLYRTTQSHPRRALSSEFASTPSIDLAQMDPIGSVHPSLESVLHRPLSSLPNVDPANVAEDRILAPIVVGHIENNHPKSMFFVLIVVLSIERGIPEVLNERDCVLISTGPVGVAMFDLQVVHADLPENEAVRTLAAKGRSRAIRWA